MSKHERARELADSWINGNRSFVIDEIKAECTNGIRGDLNMAAAVTLNLLEWYEKRDAVELLKRLTVTT